MKWYKDLQGRTSKVTNNGKGMGGEPITSVCFYFKEFVIWIYSDNTYDGWPVLHRSDSSEETFTLIENISQLIPCNGPLEKLFPNISANNDLSEEAIEYMNSVLKEHNDLV